jgi:DNA-binding transcriptional ArsR family regulator
LELAEFEGKAAEAAKALKLLANEHRLLILCQLVAVREQSVGALADTIGLSQSALSQHLARMREDGVVTTRKDGQTVFYRIQDPDIARILKLLKEIYCP